MQNHQADSPIYVWPDVWSADLHLFIKKYGPTWHKMSSLRPGVTKQHKTNKQTITKTQFSDWLVTQAFLMCVTYSKDSGCGVV